MPASLITTKGALDTGRGRGRQSGGRERGRAQRDWDWLGNQTSWDDDSAVFYYERSLGEIVNGADLPSEAPSRRTGALYVASNLPATPVTADDGGWVEVRYGEDGNALAVTVHGRCGDPDENEIPLDCRTGGGLGGFGDEEEGGGTDDPEEAVDLSCAYSCATEQHFTYAWDEVNRIAHARRLDREDGGDWELAVEQRYLYDANNQRTVKTTTFRGLESGSERSALYVYPGDFERRGLVKSMSGTSYDAVAGDTETQYGVGGARIVWRTSDRDETLDRDQRITISLTDLIQSTTAVIDLATGELVEAGSYYANGARETYRSNETETVTPEPNGFTGKEADEEVGLTYFGHRYLMAHLGRWASPDPLHTHQVGGGEALNGYHYIAGNLLQARDPLGLKSEKSTGAGHHATKQASTSSESHRGMFIERQVLDNWTQQNQGSSTDPQAQIRGDMLLGLMAVAHNEMGMLLQVEDGVDQNETPGVFVSATIDEEATAAIEAEIRERGGSVRDFRRERDRWFAALSSAGGTPPVRAATAQTSLSEMSDTGFGYDPNSQTIYVHPHATGGVLEWGGDPGDEGMNAGRAQLSVSPFMQFGHELGHHRGRFTAQGEDGPVIEAQNGLLRALGLPTRQGRSMLFTVPRDYNGVWNWLGQRPR